MLRGVLAKVGTLFACVCMVFVTANAASAAGVQVTTAKDDPTVNVSLSEASWYGNDMSVTCYAPGYNSAAGLAANSKYVVYLDQVKAAAGFTFTINTAPAAGEYKLVLGCKGSKLETVFKFGENASAPAANTPSVIASSVPAGIKAVQSAATAVKVSWGAVGGAGSYDVYRSVSAGKGYAKIGSAKTASFTDKKVKAGKTYYYKVAISGSNNMSAAAKVSVLKAPKVLVKAGKKKITVSWKKVSNAKGYKVYVSAKSKKGYKLKAAVKGKAKTKCVIKKLKRKKKYYVKVAAYRGSGKKIVVGKQSSAVKVKVK